MPPHAGRKTPRTQTLIVASEVRLWSTSTTSISQITWRFAARRSGLASGLARAVRPAGLAEAPGSRVCPKGRAVGAPLTLEGPARTMRGAPVRPAGRDILTAHGSLGASASAWSWCWRARQWDTTGTAGGRSLRPPCAAVAAPWGLRPKDAAKSAAPQRRDPQVEPRPPTAGHPWPLIPSRLLASALAVHGQGRQDRRAEGAPLKPYRKL